MEPGFITVDCGHELLLPARITVFSIAKAQFAERVFEVKSCTCRGSQRACWSGCPGGLTLLGSVLASFLEIALELFDEISNALGIAVLDQRVR
jgi:hypothetical protein